MIKIKDIDYLYNELQSNRRYIHENPEIGFNLPNTQAYVIQRLQEYGISDIKKVGQFSIVATIKNGDGPIIGLRADMDALPMKEESDNISYCSKKNNMMHACGHDAHTAILLSASHYLASHVNEWSGTVKLIFQEAEEGPVPGGAQAIVNSGVVDDVQVFFGLHCAPNLETGTFSIKSGEAMAAADTFKIVLIGKGAHAAFPHLGIDPIIMLAETIQAIQTIPSRIIDPTENCVITVAQVHSGTTHNIIPESAFMEGTVRSFSNLVREKIFNEIEKILKSITIRYGGKYQYEYIRGYDPLINQTGPTDYLKNVVKRSFGNNALIPQEKATMGAEDFSKYINHKTGAFVWLGTSNSIDTQYSLHHPRFNIDENALLYGTTLMINLVINSQNKKEILK